ncbi:MliC family protein [Paraburkholderia sp.]|uniref:MliC family protein n=1 Tax=Paraburkholderia sp. TaxID=1926495 RepID=UPI00238B85D2|nr:MliC family protein [Paraburkholderia sp.]MDE1182807.1 MliC family protein [Paraburkholderia sp.]
MIRRAVTLAAAVVLTSITSITASTSWAAPLRLAEIQTKNRLMQKYTCATGRILQVTYWNTANGQSFALVPVKGKQLLFVDTVAASGVRYQAGSYVWWTKGPRADLYDTMQGENAPPILSDCVTIVR